MYEVAHPVVSGRKACFFNNGRCGKVALRRKDCQPTLTVDVVLFYPLLAIGLAIFEVYALPANIIWRAKYRKR